MGQATGVLVITLFKTLLCHGEVDEQLCACGTCLGWQVTYGRYTARGCVVVDHDLITCQTAPGIGYSLPWSVTIRGQQSINVITMGYSRPSISCNMNQSTWLTSGNFVVRATWSQEYIDVVRLCVCGAFTKVRRARCAGGCERHKCGCWPDWAQLERRSGRLAVRYSDDSSAVNDTRWGVEPCPQYLREGVAGSRSHRVRDETWSRPRPYVLAGCARSAQVRDVGLGAFPALGVGCDT